MTDDRIPFISVLMPVYNAAAYVQRAVESVLDQSFTHFEFIIINDGSTDQSMDIIQRFDDKRIRILHQPNGGIARALNHGLQLALGKYIARFDADDICYPERLQKQYDFLNSHPDHILCGCKADYVDDDENYVFTYSPPGFTNEEIQAGNKYRCPFIHSGVMFLKDVITGAGGYNENAFCFQDHLLWMNILPMGKLCNLPLTLLKVRINPQSISIDEKWRPRRFMQIKQGAIDKLTISVEEGREIKEIVQQQQSDNTTQMAYHSLLAKKYLWDNYQPLQAREEAKKAIQLKPFSFKNYALFVLSFLPEKPVKNIYSFLNERTPDVAEKTK